MVDLDRRMDIFDLDEVRERTPLTSVTAFRGAFFTPVKEGVVELRSGSLFSSLESAIEAKKDVIKGYQREKRQYLREHPELKGLKEPKRLWTKIKLPKSLSYKRFMEAVYSVGSSLGHVAWNVRAGTIQVEKTEEEEALSALKEAGFRPIKIREVYASW